MSGTDSDKLLEVFSQQLDRIDEKYNSNLSKIESKLDRLMELTMAVAMLQERSTKQGGDIIDLKMEMKANRDATDLMHKRIHERLDNIHKDIEQVDHRNDEKIKSVDSTVKKYIYIAMGIGIACGAFFSIFEVIGYEYSKAIKDDYTALKSKVEIVINDVRQLELSNSKQDVRLDHIDTEHPGLTLNKDTIKQIPPSPPPKTK